VKTGDQSKPKHTRSLIAVTCLPLNTLQSKYESKGYDQPELDDITDALQRVAKDIT
jgi:hypothetical protein